MDSTTTPNPDKLRKILSEINKYDLDSKSKSFLEWLIGILDNIRIFRDYHGVMVLGMISVVASAVLILPYISSSFTSSSLPSLPSIKQQRKYQIKDLENVVEAQYTHIIEQQDIISKQHLQINEQQDIMSRQQIEIESLKATLYKLGFDESGDGSGDESGDESGDDIV